MCTFALRSVAVLVLVLFATSTATSAAAGKAKSATQTQTRYPSHTLLMGWNNWSFSQHNATDKDIRDAAKQFAAIGMKHTGYGYASSEVRTRDLYGVAPTLQGGMLPVSVASEVSWLNSNAYREHNTTRSEQW